METKEPKKFLELRAELVRNDMTLRELATALCLATSRITARMAASCDWTLGEMWLVMEMLNLPPEDLHIYFPKGGMRDAS